MKRTHKEVLKAILKVLDDGKAHAYGDLERRANTNWQTIRNHCEQLILFKGATLSDAGIQITPLGLEVLKELQKTS